MKLRIDEYIRNLEEGKKYFFNENGLKIILVKHQGKIYAIDSICTHEYESLIDGIVEDGCIECPKHGAKFDLDTGEVKALPALHPIKTYKVTCENNQYFLNL